MDSPVMSARCSAVSTSFARSGRTIPMTSFMSRPLLDSMAAARAYAAAPQMASIERQVLTGPDWVARAAASAVRDRRARWMLRQPRHVRLSYAESCFGRPDEAKRAEAWMLHQPDDVRHSYVTYVLDKPD